MTRAKNGYQSTPVTTHCAKRRKTTGENSIPKPKDCSLHASVSEGPNMNLNTSRTTERRSGTSVENSSEYISANPIGVGVIQCIRSDTSGQNNVSSSTGPAPENDCDPILQVQMVQTTDLAVPVTEEVSRSSIYESSPGFQTKVQALRRQELNAPLISTSEDNSSILEVFSPPSVSSRYNTAVLSSTTFDGHGRNSSEFLEDPSHLSVDGNPKITLTAGVHPDIVAPSLSRLNDDSYEGGCVAESPIPRTPAGFNTARHSDVSNITSPGDTAYGQSRHASKGSHVPSTGMRPSTSNVLVPKKQKARKTVKSDRRYRKASSNGSSSKQEKDKPKLITPLEYAQKLQSCLDLHVNLKTNYLKGKRIFYVGGDMMYASTTTRGRMEYIVKHGGTLVPRYDPAIVTHIVTDAGVRHTLQALSLKSLSDIPDDIPTVTWDWVVSGYGRARKRKSKLVSGDDDGGNEDDDSLDFEFMHAAFSERLDAGCNWKSFHRPRQDGEVAHDLASRADSANDHSGDISHISTFSQESKPEGRGVSHTVLPPAPLAFKIVDARKADEHAPSGEGEKASENEDPLSEYYAKARADREAQVSIAVGDPNDLAICLFAGFTCDLKEHKPTTCVNQHIVDKLEELRELHKAKASEDDRWRAYSYGKCIPALRNYPKAIRSFSEARSIRGVGEKTALKIMEIVNTGDLRRIKYENTEDVAATRIFKAFMVLACPTAFPYWLTMLSIHSGRHTAFAWFSSGLRTLDDVRTRKGGLKLSTAQEIGLKFY
ncbi:hypothetical protein J3R83DRAFT_10993 [Lanmaoa asiatica]|nr:hypothetical protein J3R83DRAFT_10993 [Lanmaoa asiatica]